MSFEDDLNRFSDFVNQRVPDMLVETAEECHRSIQIGSALTGAPGQPVDTGALRASWQLRFPSPTRAEISTNLPYAQPIEDGVGKYGPLHLRSAVGGFHSVKLTVLGFRRIVDFALRKTRA